MPRQVDAAQRKTEIGAAALRIGRTQGLDAVTFRSVAAEMGASSTTVVTHYAPTRHALIALMTGQLFSIAEKLADQILPALDPAESLALLCESVLPTTPESRLLASLALQAGHEFGTSEGVGDELEGWSVWLHERVRALVAANIASGDIDSYTDVLLGAMAGISMYGLIDSAAWPPDRMRAAMATVLSKLGLDDATVSQ